MSEFGRDAGAVGSDQIARNEEGAAALKSVEVSGDQHGNGRMAAIFVGAEDARAVHHAFELKQLATRTRVGVRKDLGDRIERFFSASEPKDKRDYSRNGGEGVGPRVWVPDAAERDRHRMPCLAR